LKVNGTWSATRIEPAAAERWISMLRDGGLIDAPVRYDDLVDTELMDTVEALSVG
jgi:hypothetical protein